MGIMRARLPITWIRQGRAAYSRKRGATGPVESTLPLTTLSYKTKQTIATENVLFVKNL